MIRKSWLLILPTVMLGACASTANAPPPRMEAPVADVLSRARDVQWRVRVHADSVYEGRVMHLQNDAARVGEHWVPLDRVRQVDRAYDSELRGKRLLAGAAIAAVAGYSLYGMLKRINDRSCETCFFLFLPAIGVSLALGVKMSTVDDRPEWTTIWQR